VLLHTVYVVFDHDENHGLRTPEEGGTWFLTMTKTMCSGPPKKEAATYLAATDMPVYNLIDPDTLHVTARTELLLTFGTSSSLVLTERKKKLAMLLF
jgi:hypothetical protein